MKPVRLIPILALLALAGCSAKYGCKGLPDDPTCLSAVEAYKATDRTPVKPDDADGKTESKPNSNSPMAAAVRSPESAPNPKIDDPTPLRTPAQVMRIWIAPWEDADGDLNVSGYVYTELEPRRWMIGKSAPTLTPVIAPLQVRHRESEDRRKSGRATTETDDPEPPLAPLYGSPEAKNH